jgi:hypothetical protein
MRLSPKGLLCRTRQRPRTDPDQKRLTCWRRSLEKQNRIVKIAPGLQVATGCKNIVFFRSTRQQYERIPKFVVGAVNFNGKAVRASLGNGCQLVFVKAHLLRKSLVEVLQFYFTDHRS